MKVTLISFVFTGWGAVIVQRRRVSTYDHFFIWENFSHIESTILTGMIVEGQIEIPVITTPPKLARFGNTLSLS